MPPGQAALKSCLGQLNASNEAVAVSVVPSTQALVSGLIYLLAVWGHSLWPGRDIAAV